MRGSRGGNLSTGAHGHADLVTDSIAPGARGTTGSDEVWTRAAGNSLEARRHTVLSAAVARASQYAVDRIAHRIYSNRADAEWTRLGHVVKTGPVHTSTVPINHFLLLPVGDMCNLGCSYCYESSRGLVGNRMTVRTLKAVLSHAIPHVSGRGRITVHGGEPLLAGREFFEHVVREIEPVRERFDVSVQTNGTLIDPEWAAFFSDYDFEVSVSIDGSAAQHDQQRTYRDGRGSWRAVMQGLTHLKDAGVSVGSIAVFTKAQTRVEGSARDLFEQLRTLGIKSLNIQPAYSPIAGRQDNVDPDGFATFMIELFEAMLDAGDPEISVTLFESVFQSLSGQPPAVCYFSGRCSSVIGVTTDGTVIPCTRPFVGEFSSLGNLVEQRLSDVYASDTFQDFVQAERRPRTATSNCQWASVCMSGCPHERLGPGGQDVGGTHVYCTCGEDGSGGYPALFSHLRNTVDEYSRGAGVNAV